MKQFRNSVEGESSGVGPGAPRTATARRKLSLSEGKGTAEAGVSPLYGSCEARIDRARGHEGRDPHPETERCAMGTFQSFDCDKNHKQRYVLRNQTRTCFEIERRAGKTAEGADGTFRFTGWGRRMRSGFGLHSRSRTPVPAAMPGLFLPGAADAKSAVAGKAPHPWVRCRQKKETSGGPRGKHVVLHGWNRRRRPVSGAHSAHFHSAGCHPIRSRGVSHTHSIWSHSCPV